MNVHCTVHEDIMSVYGKLTKLKKDIQSLTMISSNKINLLISAK